MHMQKYELAIKKNTKKTINIYLNRKRLHIIKDLRLKFFRLGAESCGPWNGAHMDCF